MRPAIYYRVSTTEQERKETIKTQKAEVKKFIGKYEGEFESKPIELEDPSDSGTKKLEERKGDGPKLLELARAHKFDTLFIYKIDRLGRSTLPLYMAVQELMDLNIRIIALQDGFDSTTKSARIQLHAWAMVADMELQNIRERMHGGKHQAIRKGRILVGRPRYGYDWLNLKTANALGKEPNQYHINPEKAAIVTKIHEWYAHEGLGSVAILDKLFEEGVLSPGGKDRWYPHVVREILKDKLYTGEWTYESLKRDSNRKPIKDRNGKEIVLSTLRVKIPAIISKDLKKQCLRLLKTRSRKSKYKYLLAGGILTGPCGGKYYGVTPHNKSYYSCVNSPVREGDCDCPRLRREAVDSEVWEHIILLLDMIASGAKGRPLKDFKIPFLQEKNEHETEQNLKVVNEGLKKQKDSKDRLADIYVNENTITKTKYLKDTERIDRRINTLLEERKALQNTLESLDLSPVQDNRNLFKELVTKAADLTMEQKQLIVRNSIDHVEIVTDPKRFIEDSFIEGTNGRDKSPIQCHIYWKLSPSGIAKVLGKMFGKKIVKEKSKSVMKKTSILKQESFYFVRPAGRTHLGVQVPYRPGRGNC